MTLCESLDSSVGGTGVGPSAAVPDLPAHFVRRERLESRLSEPREGRVTLVTGMAGSGKSVLVAGWAGQMAPGTMAYLALDDGDNKPARFWRRLVGALRVVDPDVGDNVLAGLSIGMDDSQLAEVLAAETTIMGPAVLVLDGLEVLQHRALADAVGKLPAHLPSQIHLIVTTRGTWEGAGVHRLRLNRDLNEIDHDDLRFNDEEAGRLFYSVTGLRLPTESIARLVRHTEGWAAGLTLAGLSVADSVETAASVVSFAGDSRLVDEYFRREVLRGHPGDAVEFMVETAVLETMTADLCRRVSGRADAGRLLESLAERGVFVLRVGQKAGTYRYHRLFAEFLNGWAATCQPDAVGQAHLRAAAWCQANRNDAVAVHHMVKAHADDRALELVAARAVQQFGQGRSTQDRSLLNEIPVAYLESHPWPMFVMGAAYLAERRPAEAATWLHRLSRTAGDTEGAKFLACGVEMLWALHDALRGDAGGVLDHQRRLDEAVLRSQDHGAVGPASFPAEQTWLRLLYTAVADRFPLCVGWACLVQGEAEDARVALEGFISSGGSADDLAYLSLAGATAYSEGRLGEACTLSKRALAKSDRERGDAARSLIGPRLTLAAVLRERDQLDAAQEQVTTALTECHEAEEPRWWVACRCAEVKVMMAQGRHLNALDILRQLRHRDSLHPMPEMLRRKVDRLEIDCRLALRDHALATLICNSIPPRDRPRNILARLDMCIGRPDLAVTRLTAADQVPLGLRTGIERLVLLARAQLQLGDRHRAEHTLRRAIEQARAEGYVRVFIDDGSSLLPLLRAVAGPYPDGYLIELVDHSEVVHASSNGRAIPPVIEPLTRRERELLSYLPTHLSLQEIAATNYVSHNTIKTHIGRLYRKLGAGCRSEAVHTARLHGLL